MSVEKLITEHMDVWTGAVTQRASGGRGRGKWEFTGVNKLRDLILELAAGGRLVPTDDAFRATKRKLKEVASLVMGQAPPGNECNKEGRGTVFVKTGEFGTLYPEVKEWTTSPLKYAKHGDVLICVVGATVGKLNLAIDCAIGRSVAAIRPGNMLDTRFLYYSLVPFTQKVRGESKGSAQGVIGKAVLNAVEIRVPSLAEQHRIVQKVDELMALCDRLEQQTSDQIEAHERLVDTLLETLTRADNATELAENWARVEEHFDTLFTTEHSIDRLKQTILQLAVMGRLVPQNPTDEPASTLLQKISEQREILIAQKVIRKAKPIEPVGDDDVDFRLPPGWESVRFAQIAFQITDGAHHTPTYTKEGVPFLSVKDMSSGQLDFSDTRFISPETHSELIKRCNPQKGDLLLTKVGTTGIPVLIETDNSFSIFVSVALIKFDTSKVDGEFLKLLIGSPFVKAQSEAGTEGVGNKNLVLRKIANFVLVLPPLAEQRRIVRRVAGLLSVCDQLLANVGNVGALANRVAAAFVDQAIH